MSRFVGYIAVISTFDDEFAADRQEISPILREIADRGLGYLDESSSSPRVGRLAQWPNELDSKSVALVPRSAFLSAGRGPSAQPDRSLNR
jgi:hypothetical protein